MEPICIAVFITKNFWVKIAKGKRNAKKLAEFAWLSFVLDMPLLSTPASRCGETLTPAAIPHLDAVSRKMSQSREQGQTKIRF